MKWVAVSCPQCAAPLPRLALWRAVRCGSCGSLITRTESTVTRDSFRQALRRAQSSGAAGGHVGCAGAAYRLLAELGTGESGPVYLACRTGALPLLATLKVAASPAAAARLAHEARVLQELRAADSGTAGGYFSRLLPEVIGQGAVDALSAGHGLVLRYPSGFWGDLAALAEQGPSGLDPRHAVWIWRRMLEILGFVHAHGWCHGNVRPEHALVHPEAHAVRLISWGSASSGAPAAARAADLVRSARVVQVLLCGPAGTGNLPPTIPAELAGLVTRAAADAAFCEGLGAAGLDIRLQAAARAGFGPPAFVPLVL